MSKYSLSSTWRANFRPHLDGVRKRWDDLVLKLVAGEGCELNLEFDESYLTGDPESPIALHCVLDFLGSGIEFSPAESQLVELTRDPHNFSSVTWTILTGQAQHGPFWIYFSMPGYSGMPDSPRLPGMIFNDFVIESLTTPDPKIFVGEPSRAYIKAVDRESGLAMGKVSIDWVFAGKQLATTQTLDDGTSSIELIPTETETGEQFLTVTVQSGNEKSLVLTVGSREVSELNTLPSEVTLGGSLTVEARVSPLVGGKEVLFGYTDEADQRARTGSDSRASAVFTAKQVPVGHLATVSATINAGLEGEMTLVKNVWVKDPAARGISLWVNDSPLLLPDFVVKLRPGKEQFIRFMGDANEGAADKDFAIFLDDGMSSDPLPGRYQSMNENGWFNWAVVLSAPVGARLALVVASRDNIFVQRMFIEVIA